MIVTSSPASSRRLSASGEIGAVRSFRRNRRRRPYLTRMYPASAVTMTRPNMRPSAEALAVIRTIAEEVSQRQPRARPEQHAGEVVESKTPSRDRENAGEGRHDRRQAGMNFAASILRAP